MFCSTMIVLHVYSIHRQIDVGYRRLSLQRRRANSCRLDVTRSTLNQEPVLALLASKASKLNTTYKVHWYDRLLWFGLSVERRPHPFRIFSQSSVELGAKHGCDIPNQTYQTALQSWTQSNSTTRVRFLLFSR